MNREVIINYPIRRIISLVPSQTELLCDLGLETSLVGITKFCIHPQHLRKELTIIGGTKNFRLDVIDTLNPDLIIGNKEENYPEGIQQLTDKYPVWMSDITDLSDALEMMTMVGNITETTQRASQLIDKITGTFNKIALPGHPFRVLYLIWKDPYMAAGTNTFINDMIIRAGYQNAINIPRYPELSIEEIKSLKPDAIMLSSEPYPFNETHIGTLQRELPKCKIMLVDGEMFSWYGSRLVRAAEYFRQLRLY